MENIMTGSVHYSALI